MNTSAAVVLVKLALVTVTAPVAVAVTFVRLSALVPPVTFTWSIATGFAKDTAEAVIAGIPSREIHRPHRGVVGHRHRAGQGGSGARSDRQAVQGEVRALAVQRLVGVHRQVSRRRGAARVHVDDGR